MEKQRVLVDGIFDLFSLRYMKILEDLKQSGYTVVVGVYSDEEVKRLGLTIVMTEYERVETLKHSRLVDEIIFPCPYVIETEFLQTNAIDLVFGEKAQERYRVGERFRLIGESHGVDADGIVSRVLEQFDEYCERNLSRGYSCQDMELGEKEGCCLMVRLANKKVRGVN